MCAIRDRSVLKKGSYLACVGGRTVQVYSITPII